MTVSINWQFVARLANSRSEHMDYVNELEGELRRRFELEDDDEFEEEKWRYSEFDSLENLYVDCRLSDFWLGLGYEVELSEQDCDKLFAAGRKASVMKMDGLPACCQEVFEPYLTKDNQLVLVGDEWERWGDLDDEQQKQVKQQQIADLEASLNASLAPLNAALAKG